MTNDSSAAIVAIGPLVQVLQPIVSSIAVTVAGGAVTIAVALLSKWTGLTFRSANIEALQRAAQTEAGALVAEAADNLTSRSIPVTSPMVAAAAARIAADPPSAMSAVGMTPEALCRIVAGEIDKLQAATSVSPTASVGQQ